MNPQSDHKSKLAFYLGILYGIIIILAVILAGSFKHLILNCTSSCPFKTLTGYPCPTCGMTRVLISLSQADIFAAITFNPLISIGIISTLIFAVISLLALFSRQELDISLSRKHLLIIRILVPIVLVINWLYLVYIRI